MKKRNRYLSSYYPDGVQLNIPREKLQSSGIYKIRNKINDRIYIGSAKNFIRRFWSHRNELRRKEHHSPSLQRHANKYGMDSLIFEILEETSIENLILKEQFYLDSEQPFGKKGFNICRIAGVAYKGITSNKTRKKMSRNTYGSKNPNFGKKASNEKRIRQSQSHTMAVAKYSIDGKLIETFSCPYEVFAKTGLSRRCVAMAANFSIKSYKKFLWLFFEGEPPNEFPFEKRNEALKKKEEDSRKRVFIERKFGKRGREVAQFALTGEFIEIYESLFYASKATNISSERIRAFCRKPHLYSSGYYWRYIE